MIAIKGMELPKSCAECSFVTDDMLGDATCILLCDEWKDNENHRAENCPLTEIITCGEDIMSDISTEDVIEKARIDKAIEEIEQTLYVDSLIFGELIDFKDGKISADDVIEEFNRVTRKEVLEIIKRNIGEKTNESND